MPVFARIVSVVTLAGDRLAGKLTSESYQLSKFRAYLHHVWSLRKEPLLVYQMGKVGSATIVSSLKAATGVESRYSIYHIHWLSPERLIYEEELYKNARARYNGSALSAHRFYPGYVWSGQFLKRRIQNQPRKSKWTVITLVREPISRNVSSFFQNLETLLSYDSRSIMAPKGLAAAVLAGIPAMVGMPNGDLIQEIAYMVVLYSITLTALLIPLVIKNRLSFFFKPIFKGYPEAISSPEGEVFVSKKT